MWLHCNNCGIGKTASNTVKFFVGLCTHVLCEKCKISKKCPIHKCPFTAIEIKNSMPPKMRVYFEDPNKLLATWQKCIRFQCEQRTLLESFQWNSRHARKFKEEITVLQRYKATAIKGIEKNSKRINKMKAYLMNLAQKHQSKQIAQSRTISTTSSSSTSALSINASNDLGESGVDLEFDDILSCS